MTEAPAIADTTHLTSVLQGYERAETISDNDDDDANDALNDDDLPESCLPPEYQQDPDLRPSNSEQSIEDIPCADFILSDSQFRQEMRKLTKAQRVYVDHVISCRVFPFFHAHG